MREPNLRATNLFLAAEALLAVATTTEDRYTGGRMHGPPVDGNLDRVAKRKKAKAVRQARRKQRKRKRGG